MNVVELEILCFAAYQTGTFRADSTSKVRGLNRLRNNHMVRLGDTDMGQIVPDREYRLTLLPRGRVWLDRVLDTPLPKQVTVWQFDDSERK